MTLPGERRQFREAAALATQDVPLGECAADELTNTEIAAALEHWLTPPRLTLSDIRAVRQGRWIAITFAFRRAPAAAITVKVSSAWIRVLIGRLRLALGE